MGYKIPRACPLAFVKSVVCVAGAKLHKWYAREQQLHVMEVFVHMLSLGAHTIGVGQQHGQRQEVIPRQLPADQQQQHSQQYRAAQAQVVCQVMPYAGAQPARYCMPHMVSNSCAQYTMWSPYALPKLRQCSRLCQMPARRLRSVTGQECRECRAVRSRPGI